MKDNVIDMLFFFCKNMFKIWRNHYHDHSVNLLPLILMYRLQYGAFFKDTFLVICNWCCTAIVAQNILFLQKLHPSLLIKTHTTTPRQKAPSCHCKSQLEQIPLLIVKLRLYIKICSPVNPPFLQVVASSVCQLQGCRLKQTT